MIYTNPIYGVFNPDIVQEELRKQYHYEQMKKSFDCAKKLNDFLNSIEEVEPAYQQIVFEQCCAVLGKFMSEHSTM